jgi:hypothetical protein
MLADERPVIVPAPLTTIDAVELTVPVRVAPLITGVVKVLRVRVVTWSEPTTEPSPDISPCTCVCPALARIPESVSKPRAAM